MADAPSGGGSGWGAFEIALLVLLVIGLLSRLNGDPIAVDTSTPAKTQTIESVQDDTTARCGLLVSRPHSLESVNGFVALMGTVGTCNWVVDNGTALYAQVIDFKGVPVSSYTAVSAGIAAIDGTAPFTASIPFTVTPTTTKGYIILLPAKQVTSDAVTIRIPLTFQK